MPTFTFAGIPLLYDYGHAAQSFLDRYQRIEDLLASPPNTSLSTWQTNPAAPSTGQGKEIGLPVYNWPKPPPLKINQMYWPTGASRFSYGLFLIDQAGLDQITALDCTQPRSLIFSGETLPANVPDAVGSNPRSLQIDQLYYMQPKLLNECDTNPDSNGLYLLPVVDRRYWGQFADAGDIKAAIQSETEDCLLSCGGTWHNLFDHLATRLSYTYVPGTISSTYGKPDCVEFNRQYQNAAIMFDAAAASVGKRCVAKLDGRLELEDVTEAIAEYTNNISTVYDKVAGTECLTANTNPHLPQTLRVAYPKAKCYHLTCDGDRYVQDYTLAGNCRKTGRVKTIHSSAVASWGCECELAATPDNNSTLAALTTLIGATWNAWRVWSYDMTYARPQAWEPTGFDDHVLWGFGQEAFDHYQPISSVETGMPGQSVSPDVFLETNYRRDHFTRIQTLPLSCDVDSMFHYIDTTVLPDTVLIKVNSCWVGDPCCDGSDSSGEQPGEWPRATGTLVNWCDCDYVDVTEIEIPIYSSVAFLCEKMPSLKEQLVAGGCIPMLDGCCEQLWAKWNCSEERWEVDAKYDDLWRFELQEDLCRGDCAQAELLLGCCGAAIDNTGVTFEVCDTLNLIPESQVSSSSYTRWVEAIDCIVPQSTTGTAYLLEYDDNEGGLVVPYGAEPITIDNSDCLVLALPGERFKIEANQDSSTSSCAIAGSRGIARFWPDTCEFELLNIDTSNSVTSGIITTGVPAGPFGLTRRVKIESQIDCGSSGTVSIMQNTSTSTCEWAELDPVCEIEVCNESNRTIACDADEEATIIYTDGECMPFLIPDTRPLRAYATLTSKMCGTSSAEFADGPTFLDVCDWTERETTTTATNPYELLACSGSRVELAWNDGECGWEVVQVKHHTVDGFVTSIDCGEGCALSYTALSESVGVMQCADCTVTDTVEIPTSEVTVLTALEADCEFDASGGGSSTAALAIGTATLCVLDCGSGGTGSTSLTFDVQEVLLDGELTWDSQSLQLCFEGTYGEIGVLCASTTETPDSSCIQAIDCEEDESGASGA